MAALIIQRSLRPSGSLNMQKEKGKIGPGMGDIQKIRVVGTLNLHSTSSIYNASDRYISVLTIWDLE